MAQHWFDWAGIKVNSHATRRGFLKAAAGSGVMVASLSPLSRVAAQGTPAGSQASCPPGTPEDNTALVDRYWTTVWTAGGADAVADVLAPDELHHWGVGDDTVGLAPFIARLTVFLAAFPDIAIHIDQTIATDDYVVTRYTATATHRGPWLGVAPTGKAVTWTGVNIFRIACGKIAESWGEADHLRLLQELGGAPKVATPVATPVS